MRKRKLVRKAGFKAEKTESEPLVIDLKQLLKEKEKNFHDRLEFIDAYVKWLKKTPNKKWSRQQNVIVNQGL